MPSAGWLLAPAIAAAAAAGGLALAAAGDERRVAFTLGVPPADGELAPLLAGQAACQSPVDVPEDVSAIQPAIDVLAGDGRPAGPLAFEVRDARTGAVLSRGAVPAGTLDGGRPVVVLSPRLRAGPPVAICMRSGSDVAVAFLGQRDGAGHHGSLTVDGAPVGGDAAFEFLRAEPRSVLAIVPDAAERAARFAPSFMPAWAWWLLAALVVLGLPVLLARALAAAEREG